MSPTSLPISGLVRLGVKPRLCRSTRRAFAFIHPLMLPSTSPREALLACPPFSSWYLLFFTVESALFSPCSHSDLFLTRQRAGLAHLNSSPPYNLFLCTNGFVPFPFGMVDSGVLSHCSRCGTEATPYFSAGLVCFSFSTEACTILRALFWSRQHQQACHFSSLLFLSDSRSVLATLSSFPSFPFTSNSVADLAGTVFSLLPFYQATRGSRTLVSPGNDATDELAPTGYATCVLCNPL